MLGHPKCDHHDRRSDEGCHQLDRGVGRDRRASHGPVGGFVFTIPWKVCGSTMSRLRLKQHKAHNLAYTSEDNLGIVVLLTQEDDNVFPSQAICSRINPDIQRSFCLPRASRLPQIVHQAPGSCEVRFVRPQIVRGLKLDHYRRWCDLCAARPPGSRAGGTSTGSTSSGAAASRSDSLPVRSIAAVLFSNTKIRVWLTWLPTQTTKRSRNLL